ncbi:MAG: hypothetical protein R3E58_08575 [Phycisphaerae bacterium]
MISAVGTIAVDSTQQLEQLVGVDRVIAVTQPYRLASRELHEADTIIDIKGIRVGGPHVNVIAGPCAIESRDLLFEVGKAVKDAGASILRGGAFPNRRSSYSFQGLGLDGLKLLAEAGNELNMPTITRSPTRRDIEVVAQYADIFRSAHATCQELQPAAEVGKTDKPVFIKRGMSAAIH